MLTLTRTIQTVDAHAGGEPLRIVTAGLPALKGDTILAKRAYAREHCDGLRRFLMLEPRGHADMYGAYLLPPVTAAADFGVIFIHNEGYSDMCGHGIIALGKVLVELDMVSRRQPETRIGFDSPAGFIEAFVAWDGKSAGRTRFRCVPSFILERDVRIATPSFGDLTVDVVFGGAFYAYLEAGQAGLCVRPEEVRRLIDLGDEVKHAVNAVMTVAHPTEPGLDRLYGTILDSAAPPGSAADQANVCIFADREVDRSPTGTGTAGRAAQLYLRGKLGLGEVFVNESIVGSQFEGKIVERTTVGSLPAAIAEVSGCAHLTGMHQWLLEQSDPFPDGFFLR
jgi:trans-L-3-hydroxyproline dehydratase